MINKKIVLIFIFLINIFSYSFEKIELNTGTSLIENFVELQNENKGLTYNINLIDLKYNPGDSYLKLHFYANQKNQGIKKYPFIQYDKDGVKLGDVNTYFSVKWDSYNIPKYRPRAFIGTHITGKDEGKTNILLGLETMLKKHKIDLSVEYISKLVVRPYSIGIDINDYFKINDKLEMKNNLSLIYRLGYLGLDDVLRSFAGYFSHSNEEFLQDLASDFEVIDDFTYNRLSYGEPAKLPNGSISRIKSKIHMHDFSVIYNNSLENIFKNNYFSFNNDIKLRNDTNIFYMDLKGVDIANESSVWATLYNGLAKIGNRINAKKISDDLLNNGGEIKYNPALKPNITPEDNNGLNFSTAGIANKRLVDFGNLYKLTEEELGKYDLIIETIKEQIKNKKDSTLTKAEELEEKLASITIDLAKHNNDKLSADEKQKLKEKIDNTKKEIDKILDTDFSTESANIPKELEKLPILFDIVTKTILPEDIELAKVLIIGKFSQFSPVQVLEFIIANNFGPRLDKLELKSLNNTFKSSIIPKFNIQPIKNLEILTNLEIEYMYKYSDFSLYTRGESENPRSSIYNKAFGGIDTFDWKFNMQLHQLSLKPVVDVKYTYEINKKLDLLFNLNTNMNISFVLNDAKPKVTLKGNTEHYGYKNGSYELMGNNIENGKEMPKIQSIPKEITDKLVKGVENVLTSDRGIKNSKFNFNIKSKITTVYKPINKLEVMPFISSEVSILQKINKKSMKEQITFDKATLEFGIDVSYKW